MSRCGSATGAAYLRLASRVALGKPAMPYVVAAQTAFPEHYYPQPQLLEALRGPFCGDRRFDDVKLSRLFESVQVRGRHLVQPKEWYARRPSFAERNATWTESAVRLGSTAIGRLLERVQLEPGDVDLLAFTTVTGLAVPSIDARLMNRLAFRASTKRLPLFGLGCVAGAAGVARLSEYLRGSPRSAALLLSVELCSLTLQQHDDSVANVIAAALFGDGAAAALLVGDEHPLARASGPRVVETRSVFFPNTERVMGWDIVDSGFKIVLGKGVPQLARSELAPAVRALLAERDLSPADVGTWIVHPGGPAVIDGVIDALALGPRALDVTRDSLAKVGNLSSASVLMVLERSLDDPRPRAGTWGMLLAMGPGFCAELVLLRWDEPSSHERAA